MGSPIEIGLDQARRGLSLACPSGQAEAFSGSSRGERDTVGMSEAEIGRRGSITSSVTLKCENANVEEWTTTAATISVKLAIEMPPADWRTVN
jgi:hypothetical protein